MAQHTITIFVA